MSYLKEIDELYEERWKKANEKAQQFFNTYFISTEVNPQTNSSSNELNHEQIISPHEQLEHITCESQSSTNQPSSRKGFTPEDRESFVKRLKASGHTVMTVEGVIDPTSSRTHNSHGSFRRSK